MGGRAWEYIGCNNRRNGEVVRYRYVSSLEGFVTVTGRRPQPLNHGDCMATWNTVIRKPPAAAGASYVHSKSN